MNLSLLSKIPKTNKSNLPKGFKNMQLNVSPNIGKISNNGLKPDSGGACNKLNCKC